MSEKQKKIMEHIGREFPGLTERDKAYLMGYIEALHAIAGNRAAEQPGA